MQNGHIKCINHRLNTCLQDALSVCIRKVKSIEKGIKYAKKFVTKVKQSHKVAYFDPTLKQWVETRWTTLYDLFNSIFNNYDKCVSFILERDWKNYIKISKNSLKQLCDFLLLIKQTHESFEKRKAPTIQRVIPTLASLLEIGCKAEKGDKTFVKHLKLNFANAIKEKCIPSIRVIHWKAMLLNPLFRRKKFLTIFGTENRVEAMKQIKDEVNKYVATASAQEKASEPPRKKRKLNLARSAELAVLNEANDDDSESDDVDVAVTNEFDSYYQFKVRDNDKERHHQSPMILWNK